MYCVKCGNENKDDANFCKYCGAPLKQTNKVQQETQPVLQEEVQQEVKPKKKSKVGMIIGIIVVVVVLLAAAGIAGYFLFFQKTTIDLEPYYDATLNGINGHGTFDVSLDEDEIKNEMLQESLDEEKVNALIDSMEINLDQSEDLSNDDQITAEVTYDDSIASELKIQFENTTQKFAVSGLTDAEMIDAFENVEIEYEGYSPSLTIKSITNTSYPQLTYEADKTENIQNGDTLTITCTNDAEALAEEGYALSEISQQFLVDEDDGFTQIEQLSDTQKDNLINFAQAVLDAHTPYGEYRSYTSSVYEGMVMASKGSATDVYVIYSRTITYNKNGKTINSYGVVKYTDLNLEDINYNASIVEHDFSDSNWKTNPDGFQSMDSVISFLKDLGYECYSATEGIVIS